MYPNAGFVLFLLCLSNLAYTASAYGNEAVWETLKRGGHVVLMRHAAAERVGDPLAFKLDDCSVQRNLSQRGREQTKRVGRAFDARSIPVGDVLSSRYCRAHHSAVLAFGRATRWQPLDLLFALPEKDRDARTETVAKRISAHVGEDNFIMVTHRPNFDALTFELIEAGGFLILKPTHEGEFDIVGRLTPDDLGTE